MEAVAERYFNSGDMKAAASFYSNLMVLHPRYMKMARICRVLADPAVVPQPHRYADIVEALLEPTVTPEALFGPDPTPGGVSKAYQRWTLLVHPDKNPYPKAADAFKRLVTLKAEALEIANRPKENVSPDVTLRESGNRRRSRPNDNSDTPAAQNRHKENGLASPRAAEIDVTLSELKKMQVTLKSLKRKDIDDSELPELSATLRNVRERRFCSRPVSPLFSSTPCLPVEILSSENSTTFASSYPSKACEFMPNVSPNLVPSPPPVIKSPLEPLNKREMQQSVSTTKSSENISFEADKIKQSHDISTKRNPSGRLSSNKDKSKESVIEAKSKKDGVQQPHDISTTRNPSGRLSSSKDKSKESVIEAKSKKDGVQQPHNISTKRNPSGRLSSSKDKSKESVIEAKSKKDGVQQPHNISTKRNPSGRLSSSKDKSKESVIEENSKEESVEQMQEDILYCSTTAPTSGDSASLVDVAKVSIRELIRGLQEMKTNRTPLRLNCDLTFASYEREKLKQGGAGIKKETGI